MQAAEFLGDCAMFELLVHALAVAMIGKGKSKELLEDESHKSKELHEDESHRACEV